MRIDTIEDMIQMKHGQFLMMIVKTCVVDMIVAVRY